MQVQLVMTAHLGISRSTALGHAKMVGEAAVSNVTMMAAGTSAAISWGPKRVRISVTRRRVLVMAPVPIWVLVVASRDGVHTIAAITAKIHSLTSPSRRPCQGSGLMITACLCPTGAFWRGLARCEGIARRTAGASAAAAGAAHCIVTTQCRSRRSSLHAQNSFMQTSQRRNAQVAQG